MPRISKNDAHLSSTFPTLKSASSTWTFTVAFNTFEAVPTGALFRGLPDDACRCAQGIVRPGKLVCPGLPIMTNICHGDAYAARGTFP
jgi:hypothetical protein